MLYNVASEFEAQSGFKCFTELRIPIISVISIKMKSALATLLVLTVMIAFLTGYSQGQNITTVTTGTTDAIVSTVVSTVKPGNDTDKNIAASFSASFTMVTVAVTGAAVFFNDLR